jgi:hypothetical protein
LKKPSTSSLTYESDEQASDRGGRGGKGEGWKRLKAGEEAQEKKLKGWRSRV